MNKAEQFKKPFYINSVLVDPKNQCLTKAEGTEALSGRALDLLLFLAQKGDEVASREEIENHVWRGPVNENSLYQQIKGLRKVLGDNPHKPTFIKTIPKRGYHFVGEITFPKQPNKANSKQKLIITALIIWVAIFTTALIFEYKSNQNKIEPTAIELLRYPAQTIALQIPSKLSQHEHSDLIYIFYLMLEYHLDQSPDQHITRVPDTARIENLNLFFAKETGLSHGVSSSLNTQENKISITLSVYNYLTGLYENEIRIKFNNTNKADALYFFETELLNQLKQAGLTPQNSRPVFSQNSEINSLILQSAKTIAPPVLSASAIEKALPSTLKVIDADPKNLAVYRIAWEQAYYLINLYYEFYIDSAMEILNQTVEKALAIRPNYDKALYVKSEYLYWLNNKQSLSLIHKALKYKPFHYRLLLAYSWYYSTDNPATSTHINRFNYELNPMVEKVVYHYRNALLLNRQFTDAAKLITNYQEQANIKDNWYLQAQSKNNLVTLSQFAENYSSKISIFENSTATQNLPSKFISLLLLDTGQVDLARLWLNRGHEQQSFFELKTLDLKANIWEGKWKSEKWQAIKASLNNSPWATNTLDDINIFYFDYMSDFYKSAETKLLSLFPEFKQDKFIVGENNFRYAVYYSELSRRLNHYNKSVAANKAIQRFLRNRQNNLGRSLVFGIADAEFYALNGDTQQALEALRQAVKQEGWLPNSFWLWPPLSHNPFLKNLQNEPEFQELITYVDDRLKKLCFTESCSN